MGLIKKKEKKTEIDLISKFHHIKSVWKERGIEQKKSASNLIMIRYLLNLFIFNKKKNNETLGCESIDKKIYIPCFHKILDRLQDPDLSY